MTFGWPWSRLRRLSGASTTPSRRACSSRFWSRLRRCCSVRRAGSCSATDAFGRPRPPGCHPSRRSCSRRSSARSSSWNARVREASSPTSARRSSCSPENLAEAARRSWPRLRRGSPGPSRRPGRRRRSPWPPTCGASSRGAGMDARSSRAHDAIPFTGLDRLRTAARRTMLQRSALGLAAVALLAVAALTARSLELPAHRLVPESRSGVIVLDLSRSINGSRMGEMADLLRRFAVPGQRVGLVVFSDMAYELLPPGSPGTELRPMIGFLTPFRLRPHAKKLRLPETPWDPHFRAGTRISVGLAAAHQALLRHGRGRGVVMLVSDLSGLPDDLPRVAEEIVALQNDRIPLRIVALKPSAGDRSVFERLRSEERRVGK